MVSTPCGLLESQNLATGCGLWSLDPVALNFVGSDSFETDNYCGPFSKLKR